MQRSITSAPTALSRFGAFIAGEHGLARTFWFDYVLVPNVVYLAIWFFTTPGTTFAILCVIAWLLYVAAASAAVWRASGLYAGPSVWRWGARALVAMPVAGLVIAGVVLLAIPAEKESARNASAPLNSMQSSEPRGAPRPQASPNQVGGPVITGDQQALQDVATAAVARFPYLDTAQGAHALDLIMEERDRRIALGESPPAALAAAVNQIAPIYAPR